MNEPPEPSLTDNIADAVANLFAGLRGLEKKMDAHVAIVTAAILDKSLERALLTKLLPLLSRDMRDRLFDGHGPMANFANKIDMAYALNIVSRGLYDDLRTVNRVRVKFAHTMKIIDFQKPEIAETLAPLSGMDGTISDIKLRYLKRCKEIDLEIDAVYVRHCKATGQTPTNVNPSLLS